MCERVHVGWREWHRGQLPVRDRTADKAVGHSQVKDPLRLCLPHFNPVIAIMRTMVQQQTFCKRSGSKRLHTVVDTASDKEVVTGEIISSTAKRLRIRVDEQTARTMCALERQVIDYLVENGDSMFIDFDSTSVHDMRTPACSFTAADGLVMNLVPDPKAPEVSVGGCEGDAVCTFTVHVSGLTVRPHMIRTLWTVERVEEGVPVEEAAQLTDALDEADMALQAARALHAAGELDKVVGGPCVHG